MKVGPRMSKAIPAFKTVLLMMTWICMGLTFSVQTSTLPDMRTRLNTSVDSLSYAFTFASVGAMLGALSSGIVDRLFMYSELILGCLVLVSSVCSTFKPFAPSVLIFAIINFFELFIWVLVNSAGNVIVLSLWDDSGGAMQALHLGFPFGALIGGLISVPFVSSSNCTTTNNNTSDCSHKTISTNGFLDGSRIELAFAIVAVCQAMNGISHIVVHYLKLQTSSQNKQRNNSKWKDLVNPSKWANDDSKFGIIMLVLLTLFYVFMRSSMVGVENYITTYAVDSDLDFSNAEAAALNSVINALGGLGRAVFIPLANKLSVMSILLIAVHGQLISGILLATIGSYYKLGLWITCSCYTFFRDPLFPSAYTWADYYINLLAAIIGFTSLMGSLSEFGVNILQGYLYMNVVKESIFYTLVFCTGCMCIITYCMYYATRNRLGRKTNERNANHLNVTNHVNVIDILENDAEKNSDKNSDLKEHSYL